METNPETTPGVAAMAGTFLSRIAQRLGECIFLLPVILVPTVFTSFNTNTIVMKETLLQICVVLMIASLPLLGLARHPDRNRWSPLPWPVSVSILLILFLAYLGISSRWIFPHPRSNHEFLRWMSYLLLALLSIPYAASKKRFSLYLAAAVLTAYAISLYAIGQSFEFDFFYKDWSRFAFGLEKIRRVCGSLGNPDYLGGYLAALIPVTAVMALAYTGTWRKFLFFIASLEFMALIFTYSRGAELALFVSLLILGAGFMGIAWKNPGLLRPILSMRRLAAALGTLLVIGAVLCVILWDDISVSLLRLHQIGEDTSTTTRPMYWQGALAMWSSHPLTGYGLGSFSLYFPEFRSHQLAAIQPFKKFYVEHAHNEFLEILAETGLIGFTLYGLFFILTTAAVWRALVRTQERENLVLLGLWGGILATLIHNQFTVTLRFTPSAFLVWSFSGVIIGRSMSIVKENRALSKWSRRTLSLILLASIPFLSYSALQYYVGDFQIAKAKAWISELSAAESQQYNRERLEKIFQALYTGMNRTPDQLEGYFLLGLAYHKVYDYPQAIESYARLESLQKDFTSNRFNLAISAMKQSDMLGGNTLLGKIVRPYPLLARECLEDAMAWLKRGLESDPAAPDYHHFLGRIDYHLGDFENAEKELRNALTYSAQRPFEYLDAVNPSPDIHTYLGRIYFNQKKYAEAEREFKIATNELLVQKSIAEAELKNLLSSKKPPLTPTSDPAYIHDLIKEINRYMAEIEKSKK